MKGGRVMRKDPSGGLTLLTRLRREQGGMDAMSQLVNRGGQFWVKPVSWEYTARTTDFFFMASEGLNFPQGSDVEDPDGLVS